MAGSPEKKNSRHALVCRERTVLTNPSLVEQISAKIFVFRNKYFIHILLCYKRRMKLPYILAYSVLYFSDAIPAIPLAAH